MNPSARRMTAQFTDYQNVTSTKHRFKLALDKFGFRRRKALDSQRIDKQQLTKSRLALGFYR